MKYYQTLAQAKANNPKARWFYCDKRGVGGQTRWFCSVRILKKAQAQLQRSGYTAEVALRYGFNYFNF